MPIANNRVFVETFQFYEKASGCNHIYPISDRHVSGHVACTGKSHSNARRQGRIWISYREVFAKESQEIKEEEKASPAGQEEQERRPPVPEKEPLGQLKLPFPITQSLNH